MACSSHARSNISIDLFNLLTLPDERRNTTMACNYPTDFLLPDRKNSRIIQIINKWTLGRLTPDGNEGVKLKLLYLECAYGTKYYVIDQINGHINAIHDNNIEPTEFLEYFSLFDLNVCRITDQHYEEDDSRLDDDRRQVEGFKGKPIRVSFKVAEHQELDRYGV